MRAKPAEDREGKPRRALSAVPKPTGIVWEGTPLPPAGLKGRDRWDALWQMGGPSGVYHPVADYGIVTRYCELQERRDELTALIAREGLVTVGSQGQDVQHPAARMLADVEQKLLAVEDRLGLSPQARNTVPLSASDGQATGLDGWDEQWATS